jgi:hypothetical protein
MRHRLLALLSPLLSLLAAPCRGEVPAPKVSILIPVYNGAPSLPTAMDSAIHQTLKDIEIICVDDGSTDRSWEILRAYGARDKRIRLLRNENNGGTLRARIGALLASRGERILWLDCDDELLPTVAEETLALAEAVGADIVLFPIEKAHPDGSVESPLRWMLQLEPFAGTRGGGELVQLLAEGKITWNLWNKLWRGSICRAAAAELEPFAAEHHIAVGEDLLIFWLAVKKSPFYGLCPSVGYRYTVGRSALAAAVEDPSFSRKFLADVSAVAGKILREDEDPAMRCRAELLLRRGEAEVLSRIAALPFREGVKAFRAYAAAFPPLQRKEIGRAMVRAYPAWRGEVERVLGLAD